MEYTFTHAIYMTDAEIDYLYKLLRVEGVYDAVFYAEQRPTQHEWTEWVKGKKAWFVRVTNEEDQVVGLFWLDGFRDMTAYVHFASFRFLDGDTVACGKSALAFMEEHLDGFVNVLFGFLPVSNRAGLIFEKRLGFKRIKILEDVVKKPDGTVENASLSLYTFNRGV